MTASELIDLLCGVDPDTEVRIAEQPSWPFEYAISGVVEVRMGDREDGADPDDTSTSVLYLVEGEQLAYLPGLASRAIGWS